VILKKECSNGHFDLTVTPGAWGEAVARSTYTKVVQKLNSYYKTTDDDRGFFLRFSYAEGKYGEIIFDHMGVQQLWPITEEQFKLTKEFYMTSFITDIKKIFGVEWHQIRYQELNIPTYSCIAFFMYIQAIDEFPIAWSIAGQGKLYEKISSKPVIQWTTFITDLNHLGEEVCRNEATDVVFLVDQSGSIGPDNFELMTQFVTNVISTLNVGEDTTRVAVRTFSIESKKHFALGDYDEDLVKESEKIGYDCADRSKCLTYTDVGIKDVLAEDFKVTDGMRLAAKKILVVITDGKSTNSALTAVQAARLHSDPRNIQVIAIGVAGADVAELRQIATSPEQIYFLDNFAAFADVKDQISNSICQAPIVGGNGNNIIALVAQGSNINGVNGIFPNKQDFNHGGKYPGYVHFKLEMAGRTQIVVTSSGEVTFYMSYSNAHPSQAAYDYTFDITPPMKDVDVKFNISQGVDVLYMSAYNYGSAASEISVQIISGNHTADPLEIPIPCGINSYCDGGKCICHEGYRGNPYEICHYDLCNDVKCSDQETCNSETGQCQCRDGYAKIGDKCVPPLCPTEPIIATENQFGYAMGEIESPFYGEENYPNNFDCHYEVEAPRAPDSCYEIHIETPFSLETSRSCNHDRLELHNIQNAAVITMDHEYTQRMGGTTAVLCGNACIADGGWIGRSCGNKLNFRFKSDEIITSVGWKIKWILRPKEECDCWCYNNNAVPFL